MRVHDDRTKCSRNWIQILSHDEGAREEMFVLIANKVRSLDEEEGARFNTGDYRKLAF